MPSFAHKPIKDNLLVNRFWRGSMNHCTTFEIFAAGMPCDVTRKNNNLLDEGSFLKIQSVILLKLTIRILILTKAIDMQVDSKSESITTSQHVSLRRRCLAPAHNPE